MPTLESQSLKDLKIESLITVMKYPVRDGFAEQRQKLIDRVCAGLTKTLREENLSGTVDAKVDSDGDLTFSYESSKFHFQLDSRPNLSGSKFNDLYEHDMAITILKLFYANVLSVLKLEFVESFAVNFTNVFNINTHESDKKNYEIFEEKVVPGMRRQFAPLIRENDRIGRADFKIAWDYLDRYCCYYSLECPGNEDNTTFWISLQVQTRDDIDIIMDEAFIASHIDTAYELYCREYAQHLDTLLADIELNYSRRQLRRQ